ncbi:Dna2/Cas4 domain-containing protein [Saccharopolyspora sp. NPDC002686]|uniref:CRISPR-associated protein Cas4 n=1 Tax=Saccharopolyspora sp. NPDC002686 TaxID=3154541 RepID=UPI003317AD4A
MSFDDRPADRPWASVPISAIEHFAYCRRQAALIHLDRYFSDNAETQRGHLAHEAVDRSGPSVSRDGIRCWNALSVVDEELGVHGICDVVEFHPDGPVPIEHKSGSYRPGSAVDLQVAAQVVCLRTMLDADVPSGIVFAGRKRRRFNVVVDGRSTRITTSASWRQSSGAGEDRNADAHDHEREHQAGGASPPWLARIATSLGNEVHKLGQMWRQPSGVGEDRNWRWRQEGRHAVPTWRQPDVAPALRGWRGSQPARTPWSAHRGCEWRRLSGAGEDRNGITGCCVSQGRSMFASLPGQASIVTTASTAVLPSGPVRIVTALRLPQSSHCRQGVVGVPGPNMIKAIDGMLGRQPHRTLPRLHRMPRRSGSDSILPRRTDPPSLPGRSRSLAQVVVG